MITFYQNKNCHDCEAIEERLQELSLAHKTVTAGREDDRKTDYRGLPLPRLEDDGKIITGHNQIAEHIAELNEFKEQWEKFQSDACYCDE